MIIAPVRRVRFRQANFIEASVGTVTTVLIKAAIVVVVLFLFLLNTRTTAISLISPPVALLITALVFQLFGLSINTITLGGIAIAIGDLVDDAVVDVENVYRRLRENALRAIPEPVLGIIAHTAGKCARASPMRRRSSCWCSCRCSSWMDSGIVLDCEERRVGVPRTKAGLESRW